LKYRNCAKSYLLLVRIVDGGNSTRTWSHLSSSQNCQPPRGDLQTGSKVERGKVGSSGHRNGAPRSSSLRQTHIQVVLHTRNCPSAGYFERANLVSRGVHMFRETISYKANFILFDPNFSQPADPCFPYYNFFSACKYCGGVLSPWSHLSCLFLFCFLCA
jgi:hypothetical protein